jgi:uncharacterized membrane protein HdeD (DUF308 family)
VRLAPSLLAAIIFPFIAGIVATVFLGWLFLIAGIDLILAGIIISGLPGTLVWALSLLVGIDMVFGGASLITIALEARK